MPYVQNSFALTHKHQIFWSSGQRCLKELYVLFHQRLLEGVAELQTVTCCWICELRFWSWGSWKLASLLYAYAIYPPLYIFHKSRLQFSPFSAEKPLTALPPFKNFLASQETPSVYTSLAPHAQTLSCQLA